MTELPSEVESPFAKPSVQRSICGASVILALGLYGWFWLHSPPSRNGSFPRAGLRIELNEADANELSLIAGVGPVLANRIIIDRNQNGDFHSLEDLDRVYGIGPKTLDNLRSICFLRSQPPPDRIASEPKGDPIVPSLRAGETK